MKKLLISIFMVATVALIGVVTVMPVVNNYQAAALSQEAEDWKTNSKVAQILAVTVDNLTLTYNNKKNLQFALDSYEMLSASAKAELTAEKTHLDNLSTKMISLSKTKFLTDHAAILAKTVDQVTEADWPDIWAAAYYLYEYAYKPAKPELVNEYNLLVSMTKKLTSAGDLAKISEFRYALERDVNNIKADDLVDYRILISYLDGDYFENHDKVWILVGEDVRLRSEAAIRKMGPSVGFVSKNPPMMDGNAAEQFPLVLYREEPLNDSIMTVRISKIDIKDSNATKMPGVVKKNILLSRSIELIDFRNNLISKISKPARFFLHIKDQKILDLIKAGKVELVHVHKKTDGQFETSKLPFDFRKESGVIVFNADKFSEFALVKKSGANAKVSSKKQNRLELADTGVDQHMLAGVAILVVIFGLVTTTRVAKQ